jgi:putative transposase
MDRTIKLKLNTTPEQEENLLASLSGFTQAFNYLCQYGWEHNLKNNVKLQRECYYTLKLLLPEMPTQFFVAACHKSAESLKSAFSLLRNFPAKLQKWRNAKAKAEAKGKIYKRREPRPPSCPHSTSCPPRYDMRSYWVKWEEALTSLATPNGRVKVGFSVPQYYQKYLGFPTASADLIYRKGKFWLHVVVTLPGQEFIDNDNNEVVGIDLGLNHPAVTSKRKFLGKRYWKEITQRSFRLKRKLQAAGTKSAKRHLRKLSGKVQRFRKDCDHVLSKRIVQSCSIGTTIVIEDLTEIRETTEQRGRESRRRLHSWSFAQLRAFLNYKAETAGMRVVAIDPRHTSQTCSKCGYKSRSNRKSQSLFLCKECSYQLNADLNASYNIRDKHLATLGISLGNPGYVGRRQSAHCRNLGSIFG